MCIAWPADEGNLQKAEASNFRSRNSFIVKVASFKFNLGILGAATRDARASVPHLTSAANSTLAVAQVCVIVV